MNFENMTDEEIEQMCEIAAKNALNFGAPEDLAIPGYGWIIRKGEVTEAGKIWFEDNKEYFESKSTKDVKKKDEKKKD